MGVTSPVFLNSYKFGATYENDLFVGDINNGNIYHFELTANRTSLVLKDNLTDKVADNKKEYDDIVFAEGFGGITDLEIGPDGYMYDTDISRANLQWISTLLWEWSNIQDNSREK